MIHNKKFIGAGILPYSYNNKNQLVFLLGLENDGTNINRNNLYSDFGGAREKGETPEQTAIREFSEESMDALGNYEYFSKQIKSPTCIIKNNNYYQFVLYIKYDKIIPKVYNRIMNNLNKCMTLNKYRDNAQFTIPSCPTGLLEKVKFKWFTPHEILYTHKNKIRPVFYDTFIKLFFHIF